MNKYMLIALKLAEKAFKSGEVPIGAVIVENGKIIGTGYNKKEKCNDVTMHAELIAIRKACRKKKTWHLNNCEIYVTVEPCLMCIGAIQQSHIKKIYFSTHNPKFGYTKYNIAQEIEFEFGLEKANSIELLKTFFNNKRK